MGQSQIALGYRVSLIASLLIVKPGCNLRRTG